MCGLIGFEKNRRKILLLKDSITIFFICVIELYFIYDILY